MPYTICIYRFHSDSGKDTNHIRAFVCAMVSLATCWHSMAFQDEITRELIKFVKRSLVICIITWTSCNSITYTEKVVENAYHLSKYQYWVVHLFLYLVSKVSIKKWCRHTSSEQDFSKSSACAKKPDFTMSHLIFHVISMVYETKSIRFYFIV